jgi:hypothetical protein
MFNDGRGVFPSTRASFLRAFERYAEHISAPLDCSLGTFQIGGQQTVLTGPLRAASQTIIFLWRPNVPVVFCHG